MIGLIKLFGSYTLLTTMLIRLLEVDMRKERNFNDSLDDLNQSCYCYNRAITRTLIAL